MELQRKDFGENINGQSYYTETNTCDYNPKEETCYLKGQQNLGCHTYDQSDQTAINCPIHICGQQLRYDNIQECDAVDQQPRCDNTQECEAVDQQPRCDNIQECDHVV